ncbi:metallophosphoesterase family protein [Candidatus Omnitrophota bacterium]
MKIGVISDTHIPLQTKQVPAQILEAFKSVDMILHAGDLVKLTVLDQLRSVCKDVRAVCGNMDLGDVSNYLPKKDIITVGKFKIGITHGTGSPARLIESVSGVFQNDNVNIIIFGHSHYPMNEKRGGILYFNPGSATDTIFAPFKSYGIIEINSEIKAEIVRL